MLQLVTVVEHLPILVRSSVVRYACFCPVRVRMERFVVMSCSMDSRSAMTTSIVDRERLTRSEIPSLVNLVSSTASSISLASRNVTDFPYSRDIIDVCLSGGTTPCSRRSA